MTEVATFETVDHAVATNDSLTIKLVSEAGLYSRRWVWSR